MIKFISEETLIVSRTDLKGLITFANIAFGEVSEYDQEKMIGCSHKIIRSYDMPDYVYKSMWHALEIEQEWVGIIKNTTVDNSKVYWVKAYLNPVYNDYGKLVEYQAIRQQASDQEIADAMKEYGIGLD